MLFSNGNKKARRSVLLKVAKNLFVFGVIRLCIRFV